MLKDGGAVGADAVDVNVDADGDAVVEEIGGNGTGSPTGTRARLRPYSQPINGDLPWWEVSFFVFATAGSDTIRPWRNALSRIVAAV